MMPDEAPIDPGNTGEKSDLSASVDWLRSLAVMGAALARLAIAELALAKEDAGRLIISSLLIIPLIALTWISLTILASWIVYAQTTSVSLGLLAFSAIQLFAVVLLLNRIKAYRRSLSLPATRTQLLSILDEIHRDVGKP